jgi:hypothetical protein
MSAPAAVGHGRILGLDACRVGLQARPKAALVPSVIFASTFMTREISQIA